MLIKKEMVGENVKNLEFVNYKDFIKSLIILF